MINNGGPGRETQKECRHSDKHAQFDVKMLRALHINTLYIGRLTDTFSEPLGYNLVCTSASLSHSQCPESIEASLDYTSLRKES